MGMFTSYAAQFAIVLLASLALTTGSVLDHAVGLADYLQLLWMAASMALTAGALGAVLENDTVARSRVVQGGAEAARSPRAAVDALGEGVAIRRAVRDAPAREPPRRSPDRGFPRRWRRTGWPSH
ncbi:hypothetical protein [Nonomuraea sp. C10]|uniref:hypothetical protein n=1 Tax=Nonomuraea sp. C10 TaxID=2600577 RepID=UPI0011CE3C01|nr:hypothetical protein [Nonomuraea sp. C10]TXK41515.1 hypothetical protein FR742_19810 [Nonomuraea sp. C10]